MNLRACLDCGVDEYATYISTRSLCEGCAVARAVQQVHTAYDVAKGLPAPIDGGLSDGLTRTVANMTMLHERAEKVRSERAAQRSATSKRVRSKRSAGSD